jgi:tetratricopeptide (TPR) repeat protein
VAETDVVESAVGQRERQRAIDRRCSMRPVTNPRRLTAAALVVLLFPILTLSQASPSIQFFMPNGTYPPREIRFEMAIDNGRIETFFSDSKGKFLLTRLWGLKPDAEYRITVLGDGTSYDTTRFSFKEYGVYYIPIYLKPLTHQPTPPAKLVDLAELDTTVPVEAKQAYDHAIALFKEGQRTEAIRGLEHAVEIYPNYFRALNDLGVIYMKVNRLEDAARMFERASKIAPRVYHPRLNLGIILTRRGKYKDAATLLETLYKENQSISEVRIALGDVLIAMNRLDEAEPHLRAALLDSKLDRGSIGNAHYQLGLLLNKKQKYESAVIELSQAVESIPSAARIHLQLGGALLQLGRLADAERELSTAYRIGGTQMGGAQLMLGQIYFMEKKYESAQRAFEQYLADVPDAPNATEVRAFITRIKTVLGRS